jgi:hypothetical protein
MIRALVAALGSFSAALLLHAQAPDDDSGFATLQGRAVNAVTGEPVRKAVVELSERGVTNAQNIVGSTDADGNFRFKHVAPGDYDLSAEKNGFLDVSYDTVLSVRAGDELKDLTLKLPPAAAISGRIVDEDEDPIPNAEVTLWYRESFAGHNVLRHNRRTTTNDAGEFRIGGLDPGNYFVSVNKNDVSEPSKNDRVVDSKGDPVALRYARTFYPNVLSIDDAAPIDVASGQQEGGIDIRLRRSRTLAVKGRIAGFQDMALAGDSVAAAELSSGDMYPGKLSAGGEFAIQGLLPGNYEVRLAQPGRGTVGKAQVDITDADRTDVVLKPYRPAQVRLHIVREGQQTPLPYAWAYLEKFPVDIHTNCELEDGICRFRNVEPGKYVLDVRGPGGYVSSVRSGDRSFSPRAIEVPEGDLDLDVVISDAWGQIDGDVSADTVEKQDEQSQPDWSSIDVALVPVIGEGELFDLPHIDSLDQNGHFTFRKVRPGEYRLYATQTLGIDRWSNPDFVREMQSEGAEVEVREKDTVHQPLKQIPKEETTKILAKLGIQ